MGQPGLWVTQPCGVAGLPSLLSLEGPDGKAPLETSWQMLLKRMGYRPVTNTIPGHKHKQACWLNGKSPDSELE